jgi:hypothetical protein
MPYNGTMSTAVHLCRSPCQDVRTSPPESRPVAVLSCCTPFSLAVRADELMVLWQPMRASSWHEMTCRAAGETGEAVLRAHVLAP